MRAGLGNCWSRGVLESLKAFFAMGGYGAFVWSAYAITFVVLMANLLISASIHKRLVARLQRERALNAATNNNTTPAHSAQANRQEGTA